MPGVEQPHHGRWFEDLTVGTIVPHAVTRTVTETDNVIFTTMTMNPAQVHLDYEYAAGTEFGQPIVNSMFTVALLIGISVIDLTHGTTVANLGFEEIVFPTPVFHGDSIRAQTEVISTRKSSSRPSQGIVVFEHRAYNQRNELVAKCRRSALMRCRPT